ncbi:hypothetical protein D3C78_1510020 [compost metagenome]
MGEQVEVLEHEADVLAQPADQFLLVIERPRTVDLDPANANGAAAGCFQQVQAAQQGGLAGAARADDRHHLARRHIQVDALEHFLAVERLGQIADGDHASCSRSWRLTRSSRRFCRCARTLASTQ